MNRRNDFLLIISLLLALIAILSSCSAARQTVVTPTQTDSTRTEIRIERQVIRDTVFITLDKQAVDIITADSVSTVETDFAVSTVEVSADGTLHHQLTTKSAPIAIEVAQTVETRDSVVFVAQSETKVVEVERELTWYQKFATKAFFPISLIGIFAIIVAIRKW